MHALTSPPLPIRLPPPPHLRLRLLPPFSLSPLRSRLPRLLAHSRFPTKNQPPRHLTDDEDEDDDDDEAAEEYDVEGVLSDEVSEFETREDEEEEEEGDSGRTEEEEVGSSGGFEKEKWERVSRLLSDVKEFGEGIIDYEELVGIYDFPVDKFQRLAIQAFLRGSSVVVSAPTSSGKTLIAEAAAVATVARGRRLFYTTPLKALSNQKFREFRKTFGDANVGLLTGDSAINKDAQILIMTTEILRNMLYQSVGMVSSQGRLFKVDVIVLDEVHYLSDISRGTVWEEIVIYSPKEVQLICLSATVANPDELAGWIHQIHGKTELITSTKRPVPLTWHFSQKKMLLPLLDEKGKSMNRKLTLNYLQMYTQRSEPVNDKRRKPRTAKDDQGYQNVASISKQAPLSKSDINSMRRSQVPLIRDTLYQLQQKDMLPAIWFIFSRRGCDAAVEYLEDWNLLNDCEAAEIQLEYKRFRKQFPDAVREIAVKALFRGIAAHHAGCLPLWKSFIEELFQRGLAKVVFATETLAAGINMPARTAVISSLTKRSEAGRIFLSPNELFQMAGRAGRRGIDEKGHVVLVQTPYEGAEECFELISSGLEPLVSQFTASYGMVLNLLAGAKVTRKLRDQGAVETSNSGRTLEEARKLVEQSFGNYVGSNVMLAVKEELDKIQQEIKFLREEVTYDAIDKKSMEHLSETEYSEISNLQAELRAEKQRRSELRRQMELNRMAAWKPLLEELGSGNLPFICLQYKDKEAIQHIIPAVYIGKLSSFAAPNIMNLVSLDSTLPDSATADSGDITDDENCKPSYYVALSSDNSWYLFTEKWVKTVYRTGLPNVPSVNGDILPRDTLKDLLMKEELQWQKVADSEFGSLWLMEGSLETWSWSLNVPVLSSLSEEDEVTHNSASYQDAVDSYKEQRRKVSRIKKKIANSKGFKEYKKIIDMAKFTKEKIERLETRSKRLTKRMEQIEPTGWKEFLQISNIIQEVRALDISTQVLYPLGETAAAIRGENELWLAMILRNKVLLGLKPAQLAAVCGSLVSEGIKVRPWKSSSYVYEPSSSVTDVIYLLEEQRSSLIHIQEKYGVKIPCELDGQFSGMVEAWASGLTWREIMMDCAMDEGDLARLLRRTIDLLAQIPKLPDIDPLLQNNALVASNVMNRVPISELAG